MNPNKFKVPTIFVVFGATGDLMHNKIVPALYQLHLHKHLPQKFTVLAVSHREMSDADFQQSIVASIKKDISQKDIQEFTSLFKYISGDFIDSSLYKNLGNELKVTDSNWGSCSNKLFYLAVPPIHYQEIVKGLSDNFLHVPCSEVEGFTRIIIEKPFGHDLKSAQELNQLLTNHFKEDQIYRLDHYLGKTMLQNILAFRFSNNFFDGAWSNKYIEKVEIKILETGDVSERGLFYDAIGALRDVGQNHLLEFLAIVAMENPETLDASHMRRARAQLLSTVITPNEKTITHKVYRSQYDGFLNERGIKTHSQTETYFKLELLLNHPRWRGVPFILESGKSLKEQKKEVVITFKKPMPSLCSPVENVDARNKMLFKLEPVESIQLDLLAKKSGYEMVVEDKRFLLNERGSETRSQYTEEYEKLLLDALLGDQTFFVSNSEIVEMWRIIDPIVEAFLKNSVPLNHYPKNADSARNLAKEWFGESNKQSELAKEVGIIGLGKIGGGLSKNFLLHGWNVVGYNRSIESTEALVSFGLKGAYDLSEFVSTLSTPRVIILSLPHGEATTTTIESLGKLLNPGDIVIDSGNSPFSDAKKHEEILRASGVEFVDLGISGGPKAAQSGACLIVGGKKHLFDHLLPMLVDIGYPGGVYHFEGVGAGHFVKMIHNAIEYGMMQSIAEGFNALANSEFNISLPNAAKAYSHGSIIESRLVNYLSDAFEEYGENLKGIKGSVDANGEGNWAIDFAQKNGLVDWAIKASVDFRAESQKNPSFTGQILSAIRGQFGGHPVKADTNE